MAVGQELRPSMGRFLPRAVERYHRGGWTTRSRHAKHSRRCADRDQDHTLTVPTAAACRGGIAQCLRRPARQVDFLKLTVGKEGDRLTVWGPEGELRTLGAVK